jgi:hypothetical protein
MIGFIYEINARDGVFILHLLFRQVIEICFFEHFDYFRLNSDPEQIGRAVFRKIAFLFVDKTKVDGHLALDRCKHVQYRDLPSEISFTKLTLLNGCRARYRTLLIP